MVFINYRITINWLGTLNVFQTYPELNEVRDGLVKYRFWESQPMVLWSVEGIDGII